MNDKRFVSRTARFFEVTIAVTWDDCRRAWVVSETAHLTGETTEVGWFNDLELAEAYFGGLVHSFSDQLAAVGRRNGEVSLGSTHRVSRDEP